MADLLDRVRQSPPGISVRLADDLALFRVAKARFRFGQSYALLRDDATVLVDAVHASCRDAIDGVLADAARPALLLLTHADLLGQAWGPPQALADWLGAPVAIHQADRRGTAARPVTFGERAPDDVNGLLVDLGLRATPVPGHTPGSLVTVSREGYVFCGDAAVGPSYDGRTGPGVGEWTHPPIAEPDWDAFEAGWRAVVGPARALLPLHGQPAFGDRADGTLLDLLRLGGGVEAGRLAFARGVLDPSNTMRA